MTSPEETPSVLYFDGRQPIGRDVVLTVGRAAIAVRGEDIDLTYARDGVRVSPRIGRTPRFVTLPDGGQLQCPDADDLDELPQELWSEGVVAWLEGHSVISAASVAIFVLSLVLFYVYGLPVLSQRIAQDIPREAAQPLARNALDYLTSAGFFGGTKLREDDRKRIEEGFDELHAGLEVSPFAALHFRSAPDLGANAFALPGGLVVVTDELVEASHTDDEVLAILAHELGHAEHRHPLASLLQGSGLAIVLSAVTGDASGIAVAGPLAISLLESNYSRETETEADTFAFERLRATGRSPRSFGTFLERMDEEEELGGGGVFESHPATRDRVQRAYDEAADDALPPFPVVLRTREDLSARVRRDLESRGFLDFGEDVVALVSAPEIGASAGYVVTERRVVAWPPGADSTRAIIHYGDVAEIREAEASREEGTLRLVTNQGDATDLQVPLRLGWYEKVRLELFGRCSQITPRALIEQARGDTVSGVPTGAGATLQHALSRLTDGAESDSDSATLAAFDRVLELWVEGASDDVDVVPVVRNEPEYPPSAQAWGTEGWVYLRYTVDADGRTSEIEVLDADPQDTFDEAAIRAVESFLYMPRVVGGQAVARPGVEIVLSFAIEG